MTPEEMREFKRTSRLMRIVSTARTIFINRASQHGSWETTNLDAHFEIERSVDMAERFEDHAEAWMESE